jgi:triphosphoribosyl-dephospho-CoA synthase
MDTSNINPEPLGLYADLACLWEATARKPGNVHRFKDFDDVTYLDFLASAAAIAPTFDRLAKAPDSENLHVGQIVLRAVQETRKVTGTNTNLGILLLLAPLAKVPGHKDYRAGVAQVLKGLTVDDAADVYQAMRLAAPGGLGRVDEQDVSQAPTQTLRQVMALAADRDLIARQYTNDFKDVFEFGVPALERGLAATGTLEDAIIACHLHWLACYPDSLIARKCGVAVALEASQRAAGVITARGPNSTANRNTLSDLDAWLRADGHRRNPGTSADLVAASLFVALRKGIITLPPQVPWSLPTGGAEPKK